MAKKQLASKTQQFAALPLCESVEGVRVMLVTSRETHRWVLPKGWAEKHLSGPELAAKEAFEEAGLVGAVAATSLGTYSYVKLLPKGRSLVCRVDVFPMQVETILDEWPERLQRERRWFTPAQAAMEVEEGELVLMLLKLALPEG